MLKDYNKSSLDIPILSSLFWCPHCKTNSHEPDSMKIKSIQIISNEMNIYLVHKPCEEQFCFKIKSESFSTQIEGEVKYVH